MKRKILELVLSSGILMISAVTALAYGPRETEEATGAVYAMTNASDGNKIIIFNRDERGILTKVDTVSTGGSGIGTGIDPLGSQNSLVLTRDNRWLLAVNGGSNEISVFRTLHDGLELVDKVFSGGLLPVSLTTHHDLIYVLNAGGSPNITGFHLSHKGHLTPLSNSTRSLGSGGFAQVGFNPEAERLILTDKMNSKILVYSVEDDGLPAASPVISSSNGKVPFGFVFDRQGHLLVVEVRPELGPNGAVSSYQIQADNTLQVISGSVANGQIAACWIVENDRGDLFTSNPGSGTVSAFLETIGTGQLSLLNGTAGSGKAPLDLAITGNGHFLYALDPVGGNVDMFQIGREGSLTHLGATATDGELSVFAQGIAAK